MVDRTEMNQSTWATPGREVPTAKEMVWQRGRRHTATCPGKHEADGTQWLTYPRYPTGWRTSGMRRCRH